MHRKTMMRKNKQDKALLCEVFYGVMMAPMTLEKASCRESAELDRQSDPGSWIRDVRVVTLELRSKSQ